MFSIWNVHCRTNKICGHLKTCQDLLSNIYNRLESSPEESSRIKTLVEYVGFNRLNRYTIFFYLIAVAMLAVMWYYQFQNMLKAEWLPWKKKDNFSTVQISNSHSSTFSVQFLYYRIALKMYPNLH